MKRERKGNSPGTQGPVGRLESTQLLPNNWASASGEEKKGVGVRALRPGL